MINQQQQQQQAAANRSLVVGQKQGQAQYQLVMVGKGTPVQQQAIQPRPASGDMIGGQKRIASQQQPHRVLQRKVGGAAQQQRGANKVAGNLNMLQHQQQQQHQIAQQLAGVNQQSQQAAMFTVNNSNAQANQNLVQYRVVQSQPQLIPQQQQSVQQANPQQIQYIQQQQQQRLPSTPSAPPPKRQRKLTGEAQRQDILKITMPSNSMNKDLVKNAMAQGQVMNQQGNKTVKPGSQTNVTYVSNVPQTASAITQSSQQQHQQTAVSAAKQQLQQLNQRMVAPQPRLRAPTTAAYSQPRALTPATAMANQAASGGTVNGGMPAAPPAAPPQHTPPPSSASGDQKITAQQFGNMSTNNLVVGEEYVIQYSNGRKVVGTWDGKFFKIKPAVAASATTTQGTLFVHCSVAYCKMLGIQKMFVVIIYIYYIAFELIIMEFGGRGRGNIFAAPRDIASGGKYNEVLNYYYQNCILVFTPAYRIIQSYSLYHRYLDMKVKRYVCLYISH